jgi:hypothetical protein
MESPGGDGHRRGDDNAIHDFREVRVVQKHKHAKAASQVRRHGRKPTDPPARGYVIHSRDPVATPLARLWLEWHRRRYQKGDHMALLDAHYLWLSTFCGPPAWLADGVVEALRKWFAHEAPTLDAAFGVRRTTKAQSKARREREEVRFRVMVRIAQLAQGGSIDGRLFAIVGDEIGRSEKTVSRIFYDPDSTVMWELVKNFKFLTSQESQISD